MTAAFDPEKDDLIEVYVDFALLHPAWYQLIWLEPLSGDPPDEVGELSATTSGRVQGGHREMKNSKTITILAFCIIAAAGIFPAVVIIPVTGIITITCAVLMLREAGK